MAARSSSSSSGVRSQTADKGAADTDAGDDIDDDWERQLLEIEENEKCENSVEKIPRQLQEQYSLQFEKFGPSQRISILKLLDMFHWTYHHCNDMLALIKKTPGDKIIFVIELIEFFQLRSGYLELMMEMFFLLDEKSYFEFLGTLILS